jgi:hypothetical protein
MIAMLVVMGEEDDCIMWTVDSFAASLSFIHMKSKKIVGTS